MQFDPQQVAWQSIYKLMIGSVLPRPIGWISTVNEHGQNNLAPYSFFNAVCANPPTVLFCPMIRSTDHSAKDTLHNIRVTGQFVVNIVTEATAEAMNITATEFPADVDELAAAGLTAQPSERVRPMRVAESPVHYECELNQIIDIGDQPGSGSIVIGRVLLLHVRDDLLVGGDKIDLAKLQPIGRLAGNSYTRVTDLFDLLRPPSQVARADRKIDT